MNKVEKEIWRKIHKQANYTHTYRYENDTKFDCKLLPSYVLQPCIATDNLCIRLLNLRGVACFGRVIGTRRGIEIQGFEDAVVPKDSKIYVALLFCINPDDISRVSRYLQVSGMHAYSIDKNNNVRVLLELSEFQRMLSLEKLKLLGIWAPKARDPVIPHLLWCNEVCNYRWWYCHELKDIVTSGFRDTKLSDKYKVELPIVTRLIEFAL